MVKFYIVFTLCQASFKSTLLTFIHSVLITILCGTFYLISLNMRDVDCKTHHCFVSRTLKRHLSLTNENFRIMKGLATCPRKAGAKNDGAMVQMG